MLLRSYFFACLALGLALSFAPHLSLNPPFRVSRTVNPVLSYVGNEIGVHHIRVEARGLDDFELLNLHVYVANASIPLALELPFIQRGLPPGSYDLRTRISVVDNPELLKETYKYEIVKSNVTSTRTLDGAWIDIVHYSDEEAAGYNDILKNMTNEDWRQEIYYQASVGIRTGIIQALFWNDDKQVLQHNDTCDQYYGYAFYPSKIYPRYYPDFKYPGDKVEAILSAADEFGMKIFVGVGLFAWRDYRSESLCWSKRVATEVEEMYGHHPSFYGWYLSGEMFAYFPYEGADLDLLQFLQEFREHVRAIDPLKPVMLAVNTQGIDTRQIVWQWLLNYLDIVTPFYFPHHNQSYFMPIWTKLSKLTGCDVWVDMELFQRPITDEGLIPKSLSEILETMPLYDMVPNLVGYEFTGLMDSPASRVHLGGNRGMELYVNYTEYFQSRFS